MAKPGTIRLRIDHGKLQAYAGVVTRQAVSRAADTAQKRVRANMIQADLSNTGGMIESVQTKDIPGAVNFPKAAVGSPKPYVKYPEFGTRAHGPVRAKALRFKPKGAQAFVFARWVRGVRPYRFMRRALDHVRPSDFYDPSI